MTEIDTSARVAAEIEALLCHTGNVAPEDFVSYVNHVLLRYSSQQSPASRAEPPDGAPISIADGGDQ